MKHDAGLPELLKTSEVADLCGVSRSPVLSWAYRGFLEYATTPSGQRRFYRHQVEALLASAGRKPDQQAQKRLHSQHHEET